MLTVKEINPEKRPDLFFMPRTPVDWTGDTAFEADAAVVYNMRGYVCQTAHTSGTFATDFANGLWKMVKLFNLAADPANDDPVWAIYDQTEADITDSYAEGKVLRRKAANGKNADLHFYKDGSVKLYLDDVLVATAVLAGEMYVGGSWHSQQFEFTADANIAKQDEKTYRAVNSYDITALGVTAIFAQQIIWARGNQGQIFYVDVPGYPVRITWTVSVLDSANIKYDLSDYAGTVDHTSAASATEGWTDHVWTFEPDGNTCDAADSRTALQRYQQGAGLVVGV